MRQTIRGRLRPLYAAAFFQGLVFWYAIQVVLANQIGVGIAQLGVYIAVMSVTIVLFEVPFGILADRWSRRGVLLLSTVVMALSTTVGGLATQPWHYLANQVLWGLFYAMYTGGYDSMVYDTLLEEGAQQQYEYWFGRVGRYDATALVLGSVVGGGIASALGVRAAFWATLPAIATAALCLARFKEPTVHKSEERLGIVHHTRETFREVSRSRLLVFYLGASFMLGAACKVFFEFDQVWLLSVKMPIALFGIINAGILASIGLRSIIIDKIHTERHRLIVQSLLISLGFAALLSVHNQIVVALSLCGVALSLMTAQLALSGLQQKHFRSRVRSGANSLVSTMTHVFFVPVSIVFGLIAHTSGIGHAVWLPFGMISIAGVCMLAALRQVDWE